jgi:hypothetical protein
VRSRRVASAGRHQSARHQPSQHVSCRVHLGCSQKLLWENRILYSHVQHIVVSSHKLKILVFRFVRQIVFMGKFVQPGFLGNFTTAGALGHRLSVFLFLNFYRDYFFKKK